MCPSLPSRRGRPFSLRLSLFHLSKQEKFHQRFLRMQPVLGLVPDRTLRSVDDFRRDLLAAVRGQAVHEERILLRRSHHVGVDLPVLEVALALLVLRLESHAGPHVRGDQVRAARRLHGVGEALVVVVVVDAGALGLDLVPGRRGHVYVEVEHGSRLQPGVADVVRVADPGDRLALDRATVLDVGVDVGEHLAGVVLVGEPVDHGHARVRGEALDDLLLEGPDHHQVAHARDHLAGVLDRLAAAELRVAGIQVDRGAAELMHARFERQSRARRGLLEDHGERAVLEQLAAAELRVAGIQVDRGAAELMHARFERQSRARRGLLEDHGERAVLERPVAPVALELVLDPARAREQVLVFRAREILELQEMPQRDLRLLHAHARAATAAAGRARNSRTSGTRMESTPRASPSFMTSGGSSRMTLSMVTLISSPWSRARLTRSPQGRSSSTPIISPWPRISVTPATPASPSRRPERIRPPTAWAFFIRPSSSIAASVASAAAQASGFPPKVDPWVPGLNTDAAAPRARHAPIGTPDASPFASSTTSGSIPAC